MNFKNFVLEGNNLVSMLKSVNEEDEFTGVINKLSSELKSIDEDSDNLHYLSFMDLYNASLEYDCSKSDEIVSSLSIMHCACFLDRIGIITYPNCRTMESFSKEDLERLANIMGTKLVYETDDFIATEAFLSNCSSVSPS